MNYTFYRIYSKNQNVTECYIGSTKDFNRRKATHKFNCNNINSPNYNMSIYQFMRSTGGFEEFEIEIIDTINFSKNDRFWHERKLIEIYGSTLNVYRPIIKKEEQYHKVNYENLKKYRIQYRIDNSEKIKQYRIDNAEKRKEYDRQRRIDNADKIKEYKQHYRTQNADKIKEYRHQYYMKKKLEQLST
jgi:hypothetical protein